MKTSLIKQYEQYKQLVDAESKTEETSEQQVDIIAQIRMPEKAPLTREQGEVILQQQIYEWHLKRKEKKEKEQEKFDFAAELLGHEAIPLGSSLKYISKMEESLSMQRQTVETIPLKDGAYLSSEKPDIENGLPLFGVVKPTGEILYYHYQKNTEGTKDALREIRPSEHFYKFNLTQAPFEIYAYKKTLQPSYLGTNTISFLLNREGERYVRKRTEVSTRDLQWNGEELTWLASLFSPKKMAHKEVKLFKQEFQKLEMERANLEEKRNEALMAIESTAAICADIFEPYCEQTVLIPRNLMQKEGVSLSVDRILPYKGENLEYLLSSKNKKPLTVDQKLDIAKQCITLLCSLYDGSLSKQHTPRSHGRIDLSHFCVLLEQNQSGEIIPKVSLIGYKEIAKTEQVPKSYRGYIAPELIFSEGRTNKISTSFRRDVYALGVVLQGFENSVKVPKTKRHERLKSLHPLALLGDVEVGVLTHINVSHLNESQQREYNTLMSLASRMTNMVPEKRPDLKELKMACGLTIPSFPALEVIKQEIANEKNPENVIKLQKIAAEIVNIIKAMKIYEEHHKQKESTSYLSRLEGYLALLGLGRQNPSKTHSQALLNATEFSILSQRLNEFNQFIEESLNNGSKHRNSFVSIFLNALNEKKGSTVGGVQEFQALVQRMSQKSDDQTAEITTSTTASKKKHSEKKSEWISRSTRVGISG